MFRALCRLYLRLVRWEAVASDHGLDRYVLVAAPHTSNWDLPYMLGVAAELDLHVSWVGKHTLFKPPFGWFMRWLGGIPVDRRGRHGAVDQLAEVFRARDHLILAVAPEGTRSLRDHWKSGFYEIARAADVPIVLGFLDYDKKRGGLGPVIHPTGDVRADMDRIREFYAPITGRRPENAGPVRLKNEMEPPADPGERQ